MLAGLEIALARPGEGLRAGNVTAWRTALDGPLLLAVRRFADPRGVFAETYSERDLWALGVEERFVQDNASLSRLAGTVRGMHFQVQPRAQAKLVRVVRGAILDVAVDLRRTSPTYGRHVAAELSAENGLQLYVPRGFAHGFCTLEPDTEVAYKASDHYAPECDRSVAWDDPAFGIAWPVDPERAVLSDKDRLAPRLADFPAGVFA